MKIKHYVQLKYNLDEGRIYPFKYEWNGSMLYIYDFLYYGYGYVLNEGITEFINKISETRCNYSYHTARVSLDNEHDLVYLTDQSDDYDDKINTPELDELAEESNIPELCRRGIIDHAVLTKKNFIHLLVTWEKIINQNMHYLLIYQDENDWYDSVGFDSLEAMEKFIADHTGDNQEDIQDQAGSSKITKIITIIIVLLLLLIRMMKLG